MNVATNKEEGNWLELAGGGHLVNIVDLHASKYNQEILVEDHQESQVDSIGHVLIEASLICMMGPHIVDKGTYLFPMLRGATNGAFVDLNSQPFPHPFSSLLDSPLYIQEGRIFSLPTSHSLVGQQTLVGPQCTRDGIVHAQPFGPRGQQQDKEKRTMQTHTV